ncbi:glucan biosynthesis protein [Eleftheria terrae]|uniref:glucan biosynthesis protein n=1 Tax=Eleftheria terrae TaxID=1597781 RepID=UPI003F4DB68E
MQRRRFLSHTSKAVGLAALAPTTPWFSIAAHAAQLQAIGKPQAFDLAWLKGHARSLAAKPYQAPRTTLPKSIESLDWDQYQSIRFNKDHALWRDDKLRFQAQFFHLGLFFKSPVRLYEVVEGRARELAYDPAMFDHTKSGVNAASLPQDLGFAGFRLNFHTDLERDISAFLGASYFRAVGGEWQYGQSARGLAIDSGLPRPEEFPNFVAYWLEKPAPQSNTVIVYALLDSPSVAGAYRFAITPGDTQVMDIDAALYPRKTIERLGIAPCTSMFQFGENDKRMANDWRPEIHDTDGLQMWTGNGEWIWRPLTNPAQLRFNAYQDNNPRGFGLLQRDRDFNNYQDDGVFYDKRPCLWVEPKAGWGAGSVQLVEIPTVDETFDNIVAFWNPAAKPQPGQELLFSYRLYWGAQPPARPPLAHVVATRTGLGGVVGQPRKYFSWRFAVDFAGGDFSLLGKNAKVEPVITASRGKVEITSARPQGAIEGWRAMFDLRPTDNSTEPINLRMHLQCDGQPLSETWLYQWTPPPVAERKFV